MIKTVIIDNEQPARETLRSKINKVCQGLEIIGEADGVETGIELINNSQPDLVFLDIQMEDGTGFDLIEKIAEEKKINFAIIFVTAYDQYAIKAIKYSALDYLLKPVMLNELVDAVKRVSTSTHVKNWNINCHVLLENQSKQKIKLKKIVINTSKTVNICNVADIIFCQSEGSYTIVYLKNNRQITSSKILKDYEELLKGEGFYRVHHSYLINTTHIESYNKSEDSIKTIEGSIVPVARSKKEELLEMLSKL